MSALQRLSPPSRREGRKGFVPYITAGDPDLGTTTNFCWRWRAAGATAIELGVPFSDPMADGPVIQRACERALPRRAAGATFWRSPAACRSQTGVAHRALQLSESAAAVSGWRSWRDEAAASGIAGVLVTDLPAEVRAGLLPGAERQGLDLVTLVAPT